MLNPDDSTTENYGGGIQTTNTTPFQYDLAKPVTRGQILAKDAVLVLWGKVEGATGYRVRRDGYTIDVGNVLQFPIGTLPEGVRQRIDVQAYGTPTGNESEFSEPLFLTPGEPARTDTKTTVIVRPPTTGLPLPNPTTGSQGSGTGSAINPATGATAAPEDTILDFPSTTVFVVGGLAVGGLALYFLSGGKK